MVPDKANGQKGKKNTGPLTVTLQTNSTASGQHGPQTVQNVSIMSGGAPPELTDNSRKVLSQERPPIKQPRRANHSNDDRNSYPQAIVMRPNINQISAVHNVASPGGISAGGNPNQSPVNRGGQFKISLAM